MLSKEEIENKILRCLCQTDVNIFGCGFATSSKNLSEFLKIDYEQIKKIMKEMKKEGLVVYENKSYTVCEDYEMQEYSKFRNIGWLLTEKARQTKIWKEEDEKERKAFKECFGE